MGATGEAITLAEAGEEVWNVRGARPTRTAGNARLNAGEDIEAGGNQAAVHLLEFITDSLRINLVTHVNQ